MMDDPRKIAPCPLLEVCIETRSHADWHRLDAALGRASSEDSSLRVVVYPVGGMAVLMGSSEQHLDARIDVLTQVDKVSCDIGPPQVAYRETITRAAEIDHTFKSLTTGARHFPGAKLTFHRSGYGQFARVRLLFEPAAPGSGFVFASSIIHEAFPSAYIPGVLKGLKAATKDGCPPIDARVTLIDGAYHDIDSSVRTFEIAAREAFGELRQKGGVMLLEPIMKVEVVAPDSDVDAIVADLRHRRGVIQGQRDNSVVTAEVPLAGMLGYATALHVLSQGRAAFEMAYDHYAPVHNSTPPDGVYPPAMGMRA